MDQNIAIPDTIVATAVAVAPGVINAVMFPSPQIASALTGQAGITQTISVGLPAPGINQYDSINRAEPFDPHLTSGDLVNRGAPIEFVATSWGVARAIAVDPIAEVTDHITIFLDTAAAIATTIPLELQQVSIPIEEFRKIVVGQSGTKRAQREKEIIVGAKLVRINGKSPPQKVEGFVRILGEIEETSRVKLLEGITVRTRKPWEDIKIKIARVA